MAGIATYNRKRDFSRTAEPPGKVSAPSKGDPQFVIQKHDASRLHYDFRLEIDGVLCSWALPKGPSLDPGEKRLAVRTEDHPMEYGGFEGTIPEGQYGGGTVMLWDQGTFKPVGNAREGLRKGDLKFELHGQRLRGSFVLARMRPRPKEKGENWLLIKHRDDAAKPGSGDAVVRENIVSVKTEREMEEIAADGKTWRSNRAKKAETPPASPGKRPRPAARPDVAGLKGARKARMPQKMSPQLATLIEEPPAGADWLSEIKLDGYRMLARIADGEVRIFSRNGLPWEKKLPKIARSLARLKVDSAWLDGEIVVLDDEGRSSFGRLKNALGGDQGDLFFFLFDIPYLDGYSLMNCRQDDRKAVLEQVLGPEPPAWLKYSDHMAGLPERIRQRACEMNLEGIIVKAADAPYKQQRTRSWLKLKCIQREEFVVVGFTAPQGAREGFGALHLGYYDADGRLHYAGGCGSGFRTRMLKDLHERLRASTRKIPPSILIHGDGPPKRLSWVKPEMVVETQFTEWTDGGSIRHAVFLGVRDDKTPSDVVRDPPTEPIGRFSGAGTVVTAVAAKPKKAAKKIKDKPPAPAVIDHRRDEAEGVRLTHPDKLLWPDDKISKADLAAYWARAGMHALPHIAGRPLALVRCPEGIKGEQFFQKKASPGFPRQIEDLAIGDEQLIAIRDAGGLRALSQISAIEIHPWGSTVEDIERPTQVVIDLDPDKGLDFDDVIDAALQVRDAFKSAGLVSFCKTTGGKGLHVVVPFRPTLDWDEAKALARSIATAFTRAEPQRFTDVAAKKARSGRIFIDYLRNGRGATAVAPFSPRARPGAAIAMPLKWNQVKPGLDPADYTIKSSDKQLADGAAAWKEFFDTDQTVSAKIRRAFETI